MTAAWSELRIARRSDQFHEMHRRSTEDIAALLNELGLDIVVDLAGPPKVDGSSAWLIARRRLR
jgi:hypothetical protein